MGVYRMLQDAAMEGLGKRPVYKRAGELVEVNSKAVAHKLLSDGIIGPHNKSHRRDVLSGEPDSTTGGRVKRVGIWQRTSKFYSGGRLYLYQYAWTLADLGAEVYIITNTLPKWTRDYPPNPRITVRIEGKDRIPPDLDLIVTDSKGLEGHAAVRWREAHPHVPFVGVNFETPNWMAEFDRETSRHMADTRGVMRRADSYIAISHESARYFKAWLGNGHSDVHVLYPAVNTFGVAASLKATLPRRTRPYAVWSARVQGYKGHDTALRTVLSLDEPLDLVMFGQPEVGLRDTPLHEFVYEVGGSDEHKFAWMRGAAVVLAPSLFEGFGIVPGEALCCGVPCVVYDLPVLREVYGDLLVYAKHGDAEDFKAKVRGVLSGSTRPAVTITAREAQERYGMTRFARDVECLPRHAVRRKSVSAQMICYYGPTVAQALKAIYPHVDQIVIAHGPTKLWKHVPPDGSLDAIQAFPDPDGKILLESRAVWEDKLAMRQWCAEHQTGNYMMIVDADEIYVGLDEWLAADIRAGCPKWVHFWHDRKHWVHDRPEDRRWGRRAVPYGSVHPHLRWTWWRGSSYFSEHCIARDARRTNLNDPPDTESAVRKSPETYIYHLGHVLHPQLMSAKHDFYETRDGRDAQRLARRKAWTDWKGALGWCGDGVIRRVDWKLPAIVEEAFEVVNAGR